MNIKVRSRLAMIGSLAVASATMIGSVAVASVAWAVPCPTASLADYTAPGFSCTVGDLLVSSFRATGNFVGSNNIRTANGPADIQVTPQISGDEMGFAFSNLNVSFSGTFSNTVSGVDFEVAALAGAIADASVQLGVNRFTGPGGRVQADFGDLFCAFFCVRATADSSGTLSGSAIFPGVPGFRAVAGAAAIVDGFAGGSAFVDSYTILLSTAQVPEPSALLLVGAALLGLGARRWRQTR